MCALSVFNFISQLYIMPKVHMKVVIDASLKFMLGPGQWLHGVAGHPFFRAAVDLGMKAVPRCPEASMLAIAYNTTTKFLFVSILNCTTCKML